MPSISRFMIRLALVYFLVGVTIGALLLVDKALVFWPDLWKLRQIHIAWSLEGWLLNLVFGTAYWILPRRAEEPERGRPTVTWIAVTLINVGILGQALYLQASVICRLCGCVLFVVQMWPRIYSFRQLLAKGGGVLFPRGEDAN